MVSVLILCRLELTIAWPIVLLCCLPVLICFNLYMIVLLKVNE